MDEIMEGCAGKTEQSEYGYFYLLHNDPIASKQLNSGSK
jgi:hypothetical protein